MPAQTAAHKIIEAAREGKTEVVLGGLGHLRIGVGAFFPELMAWTMAIANRLMPRGRATSYHTGAQSSAYYDNKKWTYFLRKGAEKVEQDLNQVPKDDAKFNLGLLH